MNQRTRINRHPERAVTEEAAEILTRGLVAHVGFCQDGQPFVMPFSYHYDPDDARRVYLHGSQASRALLYLASGAPVCITVTLLDGLVYSRTAMYHSMNYRSVVCFGRVQRLVQAADHADLFERMIERYFPGRTAGQDYEAPPESHLRSTALIEVEIEEWSAKARRGGPLGPRDAETEAPGTCGVHELRNS